MRRCADPEELSVWMLPAEVEDAVGVVMVVGIFKAGNGGIDSASGRVDEYAGKVRWRSVRVRFAGVVD